MAINRKACKKQSEIKFPENNSKIVFDRYIDYYGDDRLTKRLLKGRTVKPCGKECWEYGMMIAKGFNHSSFVNFKELMDDKDFLIAIASITPNPTECVNYFYLYINPYLKKDENFRYEFLKAIYSNDNVYKLEDIKLIVDFCGLEKENKKIKDDESVRLMLEDRLFQLDNGYYSNNKNIDFGMTKEELTSATNEDFKDVKDSVRMGLKDILSTFKTEIKTEETLDDIRNSIGIQFF